MKKRILKSLTIIAFGFGTLVVGAQTAAAQKGVINLDESVIKGRIQKPEAFYILQNANLNYKALKPKQSFIPELLKTVKRKPF